MDVNTSINEDIHDRSFSVDAYNRLNKRQFISKLAELEGVHITKKTTLFSRREFCWFVYKDDLFSITVDDWDYSFVIKSENYNRHSLRQLENYFSNVQAPKPKTRPVFILAGIVLIGLALYVNLFSS
jgi:hypothetical protein